MNTILDLFRESFAFKVVMGIIAFVASFHMNDAFEKKNEIRNYQTEVSFENKFLQAEAFDYYGL